ncbi:MAG: hypothetical protein IPM79_37095 [Polyangiaceae bacterium]|jgi:hypothetical protein|nr:hypothetical protein [Polyangiaceae bacterium]
MLAAAMARRWARLLVSMGASALVALAGPAHAQAPTDLQRAQRAFEEGERAEKKGDCAAAVTLFEEALSIVETAQLRMRAGRCKEKLGRLVEAVGDYQRATTLAQKDPELLALAQSQLASVLPRVPKISFETPAPLPSDAMVTVDGSIVRDVGTNRLVDPGTHAVKVTASGYRPFEAQVLAEERKVSVLRIELTPLVAPPPPPPPNSDVDPVPWILLGSAGATLGAAIGLGAHSFVLAQQVIDELPAPCREVTSFEVACDSEELPDLESAKVEQNVFLGLSVGAAIITAGLLVTSVTMIGTSTEPSKVARVRPLPWLGPEGAGLGLSIDL